MDAKHSTELPHQRWARLREDMRSLLRRGAWYRVVAQDGPSAVLLAVRHLRVSFPLTYLEFSDTRPRRWTVVPRPRDGEMLPESWGPFYAVCPNCADRARVSGARDKMRCHRCGRTFEVAWDERYLLPPVDPQRAPPAPDAQNSRKSTNGVDPGG